jgi:hypothetical protein
MIENWMLADPEYFKRRFDIDITEEIEGAHGKAVIKRLLSAKQITYHELTIGVEIFGDINPKIVRDNSRSFQRMALRTEYFCRWMRTV